MSWFAAFVPHGGKAHATPTPPKVGTGYARDRVSLCGLRVYTAGPLRYWPLVGQDRCLRCQARIDKTPPEKAP